MKEEKWLYEISAKRKLIDINLKEVWRYRDLLMLFVKRDIVTVYKQTVLGPLWYFIQPLFTSVIFTLIFNKMGQIDTGGVPPFLFNLAGITAWNYFKICLTSSSNTFKSNARIFGKVYFPRIIMPISVVISNLLKFGIQLVILIGFYIYYRSTGSLIAPNMNLLLFPVYVLMMGLLSLGAGMIISAYTTKYKDLQVMLTFIVQLLMYLSAVPYPVSEARAKFPTMVATMVEYNPMTQIIEGFRYMILGTGTFDLKLFLITLLGCSLLFLIGIVVFNKTEKTFIDTI